MSVSTHPAVTGSFPLSINYELSEDDAGSLGDYLDDIVLAAFFEIASLGNDFSIFYHYFEVTKSGDGETVRCSLASFFDLCYWSVNIRIKLIDEPVMICLPD